ncbi:hypothetical protein PWK10_10295 [Caloramator sp. Dgby_cultured_2]|nr:hypothetical protein [Caloramator sp. Dgby_cultured_2]WDU82143.1 hypothetical protein PWK10_10295 [Caloramator sp. Dgby_cultured_2]
MEGLNFGFIGGATGLIGKDNLAFYGSLDYHPEGDSIKNFCQNTTLNGNTCIKVPF